MVKKINNNNNVANDIAQYIVDNDIIKNSYYDFKNQCGYNLPQNEHFNIIYNDVVNTMKNCDCLDCDWVKIIHNDKLLKNDIKMVLLFYYDNYINGICVVDCDNDFLYEITSYETLINIIMKYNENILMG